MSTIDPFRQDRKNFLGAESTSVFGVTGFEHRAEPGSFHFAPFASAGFFEPATNAELLQRLFPIELLFQPANGFFDRLAFFQSYFSHVNGEGNPADQQKIYKSWDSRAPSRSYLFSR